MSITSFEFSVATDATNTEPELCGGRLDKKCLVSYSGQDEPRAYLPFHKRGGCSWILKAEFHDGGLSSSHKETALKILRPDGTGYITERAIKEFKREVTILTQLQHPNIVKYLSSGECEIDVNFKKIKSKIKSYYYFMEYEDCRPIGNIHDKFPLESICTIIENAFNAVIYLHDKDIAHLDIHPGNLMVDRSGRCVLIDFGKAAFANDKYSRNRGDNYPNGSSFVGKPAGLYSEVKTKTLIHPSLMKIITKLKENINPTDGEIEFKKDLKELLCNSNFRRIDLCPLAVSLSLLIEQSTQSHVREDAPAREAIDLVLDNLLTKNERELNSYSANEARDSISQIRKTLHEGDIRLVRLSGGMNVQIRSSFSTIIDTPHFQRLRSIKQLGLTELIYPSATHSRFSHSLGAFDLAGRYLSALIRNSSECRVGITDKIKDLIRMKILIHDIGHYPFAHYFEEMMENIGDSRQGNERLAFVVPSTGEEVDLKHESLGKMLCTGELNLRIARVAAESARIKLAFNDGKNLEEHLLGGIIKGIIDGALDCDKVDYLIRDGMACGVPYASSIDIERMLTSLTVGRNPSDQKRRTGKQEMLLMITEKGIAPVESLFSARYQMFSEVYWHKVARAITAMMKQALFIIFNSGICTRQDFGEKAINSTDEMFLNWMQEKLNEAEPEASFDLIGGILEGRKIFKRVLTLSAAWEKSEESLYKKTMEKITINGNSQISFMRLQKLQSAFQKEIQKKFQLEIKYWKVLIDAPPGHEKDEEYPYVIYSKVPFNAERLNKISGLHKETNKQSSFSSSLEATHKIRIFIEPKIFSKIETQNAQEYYPKLEDDLIECLSLALESD